MQQLQINQGIAPYQLSQSSKTYYIKRLGSTNLNVLGLDIVKTFLKIDALDTTHDANIDFFRKTAIEFAQKQLKFTISPSQYQMIIGNYSADLGETTNIYYQLYKGGMYGGCLIFLPAKNITLNSQTYQIQPLVIPLKPLISVDAVIVDNQTQSTNMYSYNQLDRTLYNQALNNAFTQAQINFTAGYDSNDNIPQDIIHAILMHIYFMWVDGDFSVEAPKSSVEIYKSYRAVARKYRI